MRLALLAGLLEQMERDGACADTRAAGQRLYTEFSSLLGSRHDKPEWLS